MSIRTDLIKILANMSDDHAKTYEELEEYIRKKQDEAVENYITKQLNIN